MHSRSALLALAILTVPLSAQDPFASGGIVNEDAAQGAVILEGAPPPGAVPTNPGGPVGELDFNRLRQLIE